MRLCKQVACAAPCSGQVGNRGYHLKVSENFFSHCQATLQLQQCWKVGHHYSTNSLFNYSVAELWAFPTCPVVKAANHPQIPHPNPKERFYSHQPQDMSVALAVAHGPVSPFQLCPMDAAACHTTELHDDRTFSVTQAVSTYHTFFITGAEILYSSVQIIFYPP